MGTQVLVERDIPNPERIPCPSCFGDGDDPDCFQCNGRGYVDDYPEPSENPQARVAAIRERHRVHIKLCAVLTESNLRQAARLDEQGKPAAALIRRDIAGLHAWHAFDIGELYTRGVQATPQVAVPTLGA